MTLPTTRTPSAPTTRRLVVVSAGLSTPSSTRLLADRLTSATRAALAEHGVQAQVEVVELREHAHALADRLVAGFTGADLAAALEAVEAADGVVAVTPVFSGAYSGLFKTFFDVLDRDALTGTPVLLGATAGTARHSLALEHVVRPLFTYLRAVTAPTAVFAAPEDWGAGEGDEPLTARIERAGRQFADLVAGHRPAAPAHAGAATAGARGVRTDGVADPELEGYRDAASLLGLRR